jgi:hypothetical protein
MKNFMEKLIKVEDIFERKLFDDGTFEMYVYVVTRFPPPFKDRDCVFYSRSVRVSPTKMLIVRFTVSHSKYPPNKKHVRMRMPVCLVVLEEQNGGTYYVQVIEADLAGNFPPFMSKLFAGSFVKSSRKLRQYMDRAQIESGALTAAAAKSFKYPPVRDPDHYVNEDEDGDAVSDSDE